MVLCRMAWRLLYTRVLQIRAREDQRLGRSLVGRTLFKVHIS